MMPLIAQLCLKCKWRAKTRNKMRGMKLAGKTPTTTKSIVSMREGIFITISVQKS